MNALPCRERHRLGLQASCHSPEQRLWSCALPARVTQRGRESKPACCCPAAAMLCSHCVMLAVVGSSFLLLFHPEKSNHPLMPWHCWGHPAHLGCRGVQLASLVPRSPSSGAEGCCSAWPPGCNCCGIAIAIQPMGCCREGTTNRGSRPGGLYCLTTMGIEQEVGRLLPLPSQTGGCERDWGTGQPVQCAYWKYE